MRESSPSPPPISIEEEQRRSEVVQRLAKKMGFQGTVEYRHVYGGTGGAQYRGGSTTEKDALLVFAEAFERGADPADFSLEAIIAHERGHQVVVRHPKIRRSARGLSGGSEEILASLLGSLIAPGPQDRQALYGKAIFEALARGLDTDHAMRLLQGLRDLLEKAL